MTDDDDDLKKLGGKAAAGGALAAATYAGSNNAAVAIAAGALGTMLDDVAAWMRDRRKRKFKVWLESIVAAGGAGPGIDAERFRARLDEDVAAGETFLQAARRLEDFVHDEAIPFLGALTAEYLRDNRKPDAYFRGASRMLADCDPQDIEDIRIVLRAAQALGVNVVFGCSIEGPGMLPVMRPDSRSVEPADLHRVPPTVNGERVLHLLGRNGLAREANLIGAIGVNISASTVARLSALLLPSTPPAPSP